MSASATGLVDPSVFTSLQAEIEESSQVRDQIRDIVQDLEKQEKLVLSTLSSSHSMQSQNMRKIVSQVEEQLLPPMVEQISQLSQLASQHPYYKFNQMWTRQMQDAAFAVILLSWLGGLSKEEEGGLLTIEETGTVLNVPINLKERDAFHLTIEEYLHALISLIDELARLARNSVILGNFTRPRLISQFVKDLHAGFQILNLKNDALRRRNDGIKYRVREVEDVIYDLSLRGL